MNDAPQCPQGAPTEVRRVTEHWAELTAALWAEREAMEDVVYRLTAERLILQKAPRWLSRADEDLDRSISRLRERSDDRTDLTGDLATEFGCAATLTGLTALSAEPWPSVLGDHHLAMRVLVRDLTHCAAATQRQLRISGRAVIESLEEVRIERGGEAMHLALGQFRSVERELLVTAADATHRASRVTIDRLLADVVPPIERFLA